MVGSGVEMKCLYDVERARGKFRERKNKSIERKVKARENATKFKERREVLNKERKDTVRN